MLSRRTGRAVGLGACIAVLLAVVAASLAIGTKSIPLSTVVDSVVRYDPSVQDQLVVRTLRVPRTVLGLLVGAALGLAGVVMQGVTRNPLADPGILGVNAGAALFVVVGIFFFGIGSLLGYIWLAFAGAAVASVVVYLLGTRGHQGGTPVKLALAGAATTAFLGSVTAGLLFIDVATLDQYRFWAVGALAGRDATVALQVAPFLVVGALVALGCGRLLNGLALGDDLAASLGMRVARARLAALSAVVLLVGAATAAIGPVAFVGLAVPHAARTVTGPDNRWLLAYSAVLAPTLLLGADVIGRVVARPGEVPVGILTALVGTPVFVLLVRRQRLESL